MKEYRKTLLQAASKLRKLQDRVKQIEASGLDSEKKKRDRQEAIKQQREQLEIEVLVMEKLMQANYIESIKNAEKVRRGSSADNNERLFHQQRAAMGLRGLEPNEALDVFNDMVYGLTDEEKKHRWIYEDVLKSAVRDPDYKYKVENTLNAHRTEEEKAALQEARALQTMTSHDKTLRGLLKMDFEEIERTGSAGDYNYAAFLDEMEKNARGQESDLVNLKSAKDAINEISGKG